MDQNSRGSSGDQGKSNRLSILKIIEQKVGAERDSRRESLSYSFSPLNFNETNRLSVTIDGKVESLHSFGTQRIDLFSSSDITFYSDFSSEFRPKVQYIFRLELTTYEKLVVAGAFSEVIEQLNIIRNYLPYPKFDWGKAYENPDTYIWKICGKISEHVFPPYHEYEHSPLWKVQLDRYILQKIIEDTRNEIHSDGKYYNLIEFLSGIDYIKKQEDIVMKENINLKKLVIELKKIALPKMVAPSENQIEDIFATEDEMMLDERIKMGIEERYIEAWEKARVDQNTMLIVKEENDLAEKLEILSINQKLENRINTEISTFLLVEIAKLEDMITEWTSKYNKDLEIDDTKILWLNSEKESLETKIKNLLSKFRQQSEVIDELTKFFDEYARAQEIHQRQVQAAAQIQYWWRKYLAIKREALAKTKKKKGNKKK